MRNILLIASLAVVSMTFSGCSGNSQPNFGVNHESDKPVFRIQKVTAKVDSSKRGTNEEQLECSRHLFLYGAAKETLTKGYGYFAIVDNRPDTKYDNNMQGLAINTSDAWEHYCNPKLFNKDSGLEDDKCQYHHMGYDIANGMGGQVMMLKERTYLFPTWDANKVLREEGAKANACVDWSQYKDASSVSQSKFIY